MTNMQMGFPQLSSPLTDARTGVINQTWYQFLITLWNRTGGAQGSSSAYDPANVDITGGFINGTIIGNNTPALITGTTITATVRFVGDLLGDVIGNVTGNVTGDVYGNLIGVSLGVPGAGGADSLIFMSVDEFSYNPVALFGNDGAPFNCSYDKLILGKADIDCIGNINYTLTQDLAPCPSIRTCMLWCQWWTVAAGASIDMGIVQPAMNQATYDNLGVNTWSVDGITAAASLKLPNQIGGTSDDGAFLAAAQLLTARGYKVGICPVVMGINLDGGTANSQQIIWRGDFQWPDTPTFTTWLTNYITMVTHYFDTVNNAGIFVDVIYLASEMQDLTINGSDAIWDLWIAALQGLADYVKGLSPNTVITYAANWKEYGVGGNFRLDSMWTYSNIDNVGVDWFPPFAVEENNTAMVLQQGLRSGEQMDWTVDSSDNTERAITTTNHDGKVGLLQTPILPPQGNKNLSGFYYNYHYILSGGSTQAEATPLAGYDRTYNPLGLSLMTNVPAFGISASLPPASGVFGNFPAPAVQDTWAEFNGVDVAQLTLPTWSDTQYWYYFDFDFQITDASPTTFARLFRIPDVLECLIDIGGGNKVKLAFGPTISADYVDLCDIDTNYHTVTVRLDVANLIAYISVDGAPETTNAVADAVALDTAATMYVAGYDASNNQLQYNLYYLLIKEAIGTTSTTIANYGGTFWFDEPYCGVRTAWTPQLKPIMISQTGVASLGGSPVEPNVAPNADYGTTVTLPGWLDSFTRTKMEEWFALGWNPTEIYGAYGSNFSFNEIDQAKALTVLIDWMKSADFIDRVCVYGLDARPAATILAEYLGTLFYVDGPLYKLSQVINGKLAGGVLNPDDIPS